jgi:hypothetical protein
MLAKKYLPQELVDNIIEATASQTWFFFFFFTS